MFKPWPWRPFLSCPDQASRVTRTDDDCLDIRLSPDDATVAGIVGVIHAVYPMWFVLNYPDAVFPAHTLFSEYRYHPDGLLILNRRERVRDLTALNPPEIPDG